MTVKGDSAWGGRILIAIVITSISCLNGCAELLLVAIMPTSSILDVRVDQAIDMILGALTVGTSTLGILVMIYLMFIFFRRYRD